jgi:UDP-N-acetylmuramoylalanine--D-glutamate ligase
MTALILGCGASGQSARRFLEDRGYKVIIWEDDACVRAGFHDGGSLSRTEAEVPCSENIDLCIVSPGISKIHKIISGLIARGVEIVAEIDLPFIDLNGHKKSKPKNIVAVTGTNGKTTVVGQIYDAVIKSGFRGCLCGNIGLPITSAADKLNGSAAIIEVSSFMLETAKHLHPNIAVITNITQDHLERHGTMEEYIRCKKRVFADQTKKDFLVLNWDDKNTREIGLVEQKTRKRRVVWYSASARVRGLFVDSGFVCRLGVFGVKKLFPLTDLGQNTPHGISNALAVVAVGSILRVKKSALISACRYKQQKHKLEFVGQKDGIVFYNDSKATNIAAVLAACRSFCLSVTLIICGKTKGQDYSQLFLSLPQNVKSIVVFGECKDEVSVKAAKLEYENIFIANGLKDAVEMAVNKSGDGSVVLFSPGGSSFDEFENYEDRGNRFCDCVSARI